MASTYWAPVRRRPRHELALARSALILSSLPWRPKVDRTARRISSERDAPVALDQAAEQLDRLLRTPEMIATLVLSSFT
jgi:hypothetical protein